MNTRDLTKIAMCIALSIICAYISFPLPFTPVLITAQTIAINLIALILKPRQAFLAVLGYVLIGLCGVPVFSGGMSGLQKLSSPGGGFVFGFLIMAPLVSYLKGKNNDFKRYALVTAIIGMPIINICGAIQMSLLMNISIYQSLTMAVFPFVFGDVLKCFVASLLAQKLNKLSFINTVEA